MIKFSVLIPCYNAEKFIERSLDSVISQTYKNFEIVIVNDGSCDGTKIIVDKYMAQYDNIYCIEQTNKGPAVARNEAVKKASGDYFIFLDADDYLNGDLLRRLNELLSNVEVDIVRYCASMKYLDGRSSNKYMCPAFDICSGKDAIDFFIANNIRYGPLFLYCYNTKYFKNNKFSFIPGKLHEDFYNIYVLATAKNVIGIDYVGYNYIKNSTSITAAKDEDHERRRASDILFVFDKVVLDLEKNYVNKDSRFDVLLKDLFSFLNIGLKYLKGDDLENYKKEIDLRWKKYLDEGN